MRDSSKNKADVRPAVISRLLEIWPGAVGFDHNSTRNKLLRGRLESPMMVAARTWSNPDLGQKEQ